ncbi:MAG: glycoside hydrolase family 16 protein [Flavobacteriales bacterium]
MRSSADLMLIPLRKTLHPILLLAFIGASMNVAAQRKYMGAVENDPGGPCDTAAWKLVFHDEFDGSSLDRSKWVNYFTYSDDGSDQCSSCRVMSSTNNVFTPEQVILNDGMLTLGVEARPSTWFEHKMEHVSGLIHSVGDAQFTYGRFEIRCRIPSGTGLWPAFWGYGGETEIDVFEFCGEKPRWMKGSLHRWGEPRASSTGKHKGPDLSQDFHTYAVEWEEDELRWYLDDELVHSRGRLLDKRGRPLPGCDRDPGSHPTASYFPRSTDALNLIVNLAVSAPKAYCNGPSKPTPWPAGTALLVDHVRVYQRQPQAKLRDLCEEPRMLRAEREGSMRAGETRRYEVSGPHGDLAWSTAPGLEIMERGASGVTVRATGERSGLLWVRVESVNDPCPRGALKLEIGVEVR